MSDEDAARFLESLRRAPAEIARREAAWIAATGHPRPIRPRCGHCWAELSHAGIVVPGGIPAILTTCPRCDRYREGDDG